MKRFILDVDSVEYEIINDNDFLKLRIKAISEGRNRNNTDFLLEGMREAIPSFYNKPILAYYNTLLNDAEEHNSIVSYDKETLEAFDDYDYHGAEKPVGIIPESAKVGIEFIDGKNWIVVDGAMIWTEYNYRLIKLIEKQIKKKVSVEIEPFDTYEDKDGVEVIRRFKLYGITILGDRVESGIAGANMTLSKEYDNVDVDKYTKHITFAMNRDDILQKYIYEDKTLGTEPSLKVNKSKEAVSYDTWSKVDKVGMRKRVLAAKNYKTLVREVYLVVEDGWEEAPSEKLKYPVMQLKGGELVYNANGLLSAQQYGEKYDEDAAKKALSIRRKLGLVASEKEKKMKKFIKDATEHGFLYLGMYNGKLRFAKELTEDEKEEDKKEMSLYEVDIEKCAKHEECDDLKFDMEDWADLRVLKMDKDDDDTDNDDDDERDDDDDDHNDDKTVIVEDYARLSARCDMLMSEKKDLLKRAEKAEKELEKMKRESIKKEAEKILEADDELEEFDKEELIDKCEDGEFCDVDSLIREVAYRKYKAGNTRRKNTLSYGINNKKITRKESKSPAERLADI